MAIARSAPEQLADLEVLLQSMSIQHGVKNALFMRLQAALSAILANEATACTHLQDFVSLVIAQSGKKLTPAQSTQLLDRVVGIRAALGC